MNYDFTEVKRKMKDAEAWLEREMGSINTGRATPALLDGVLIDSYGAKSPVSHVATISLEDARTIRVVPWDKQNLKAIESGINTANLGVSVSADGTGVRVFFPELTTERRGTFAKLARARLEEARVSVRGEREDAWGDIQRKQKDGELSEDDKFSLKDALQKIVDETNERMEAIVAKKEKEIMS